VFVLFLLLLLLFAALAVRPLLSAHEGGVRAALCQEVGQLQAWRSQAFTVPVMI
jgi:uncharacterized protein HemY